MNILRLTFGWFYLFCFLIRYPLPIVGSSTFLCLVISFTGVLFWLVKGNNRLRSFFRYKSLPNILILLIICLLVSFMAKASDDNPFNDYFGPQYIGYIVLSGLFLPIFCYGYFKLFRVFGLLWTAVILFESFVIFGCVVNHSFAMFIYENFIFDERFNRTIESGSRIAAIGFTGASGSIWMSTGCLILSFLYVRKEINPSLYYILFFIILLATLFIGRTGVLIEIILLLSMLLINGNLLSFRKLLLIAITGVGFFFGLIYLLESSLQGELFIEWMSASFDNDSRSEVISMIYNGQYNMPPFPQILIGTGVRRGSVTGGYFLNSDSGYLQTLFAIGLIGFICYYLLMFRIMLYFKRTKRSTNLNKLIWLGIIVAFLIEFKEPFFLKYTYLFVLVTTILFISKEQFMVKSK